MNSPSLPLYSKIKFIFRKFSGCDKIQILKSYFYNVKGGVLFWVILLWSRLRHSHWRGKQHRHWDETLTHQEWYWQAARKDDISPRMSMNHQCRDTPHRYIVTVQIKIKGVPSSPWSNQEKILKKKEE